MRFTRFTSSARGFLILIAGLGSGSVSAEIIDRVLGVVGEEPILQSDLSSLRRDLQSSPAMAQIMRIEAKSVTDRDLFERLIEEKIIKQALKDLDITVADSEVEKQIETIAKQNRLTVKQLEEQLRREGIPPDVYRRNMRTQFERRNIFERELRRGGGVTEQEIRALYDQRAAKELKLYLVTGPDAELKKLGTQKVKDPNKLRAPLKSTEIGWVASDTVDEKIAAAAAKAEAGDVLGPIKTAKGSQSFVVVEVRKGSEEEFQRVKNELSSAAQVKDFENRFKYWLEQKRREMHIILNVEFKG